MLNAIYFIIPEYGKRELTRKCIDSIVGSFPYNLFMQSKKTIVIANDGYKHFSEQEEPLFLHPWNAEFFGVDLQWKNYSKNVGFAANVNRTCSDILENSFGSDSVLFLICNNDILFDAYAIEMLIETHREFGGIIGPAIRYIHDDRQDKDYTSCSHLQGDEFYNEWGGIIINLTMVSGSCFLISSQLWEQLGGFDYENFPAFFEDDDLGIRANLLGNKITVDKRARIRHAWHSSYRDNPNMMKIWGRSRDNFARKWPEIVWHPCGNYFHKTNINDSRIIFKEKSKCPR